MIPCFAWKENIIKEENSQKNQFSVTLHPVLKSFTGFISQNRQTHILVFLVSSF